MLDTWLAAIASFFQMITATAKTAEVYAPTDKMKEDKAERERPRMESEEYRKKLRSFKGMLIGNMLLGVNELVDLECAKYNPEDRENFRKALHTMFPQRQWKVDKRKAKRGVPKMQNPPGPPAQG